MTDAAVVGALVWMALIGAWLAHHLSLRLPVGAGRPVCARGAAGTPSPPLCKMRPAGLRCAKSAFEQPIKPTALVRGSSMVSEACSASLHPS